MRRALRSRAPALSHWFGIHPWQYERLTLGERLAYLAALDDIERQLKER